MKKYIPKTVDEEIDEMLTDKPATLAEILITSHIVIAAILAMMAIVIYLN